VFDLDLQDEVCQGEIANLAVNRATPGIDKYDWDFAGGNYIFGTVPGGPSPGPFNIVWNIPGQKIISAIARDQGAPGELYCASLPVYDTIIVHELPAVDIVSTSNINICAGDSVTFEASYNPDYAYEWTPSKYFGSTGRYIEYGVIDSTSQIFVTATTRYNCKASDSAFVTTRPCCEIFMPNAFSPNDDGRNDVFKAITNGNHKVTNFRIQNRWGQVVYEAANPEDGWDGSFNSKAQPLDTYYYFLRYKCTDGKTYETKGEVVLVR
jgi:gliding motility-associated-like protein